MNRLQIIAAALALLFAGSVPADKTAGNYVDDSAIQAKVKTALMGDNFFKGVGVNIEMHKGIVQLGGWVDSAEFAAKAEKQAAAVEGVRMVDNQLHVKPGAVSMGQSLDDGVITTRVKGTISDADLGKGLAINVDTYGGVVLLTGFVQGADSKAHAEELAAGVANVTRVINGIYAY
jgi:hyperosmotically inducible protein